MVAELVELELELVPLSLNFEQSPSLLNFYLGANFPG